MNLVRTAPRPMLAAGATLSVAAAAWITLVAMTQPMGQSSMGLGPPGSFLPVWLAMMAAMMLPTAVPFVFAFARGYPASPIWPIGAALLLAAYLLVWMAFGMLAYLVYQAVGMPWPRQNIVAGAAIAGAGVYALTPLKRAAQARCRAMCHDIQREQSGIVGSSVTKGLRYGVNCVGCSAGLMIALLIVGMSNLALSLVATGVVLLYKVAPWWNNRTENAASIILMLAGVIFAAAASAI